MNDDWKQGVSIREYETFVRFSDPHQAAEVLLAGIVERADLAFGSSAGYAGSGRWYQSYGVYPWYKRFPGRGSSNLLPAAYAMSQFCSLVQDHRWVMAQDLDAGSTVRLWNDHMPEMLNSIGLSVFADPAQSTWFHIPEFYSGNRADVFIGIASGISLLTHAIGTYPYQADYRVESLGGWGRDGDPFQERTSSAWETPLSAPQTEWFSAYRGWSGNSNRKEANCIRPTGITISNSGGGLLHFSAVFSGGIDITTIDHSAGVSSTKTSALSTVFMRETIASGGSMTIPVSGFYTCGKSLTGLLPESRHTVSAYSNENSGGWAPRGGLCYSGFRGSGGAEKSFAAVEITSQCLFFRKEE